jgi:hypothetical protein
MTFEAPERQFVSELELELEIDHDCTQSFEVTGNHSFRFSRFWRFELSGFRGFKYSSEKNTKKHLFEFTQFNIYFGN